MAIFNRSKEKWILTNPLNKTSKNRTVHFERDTDLAGSPKPFALNKRLWFLLDVDRVDETDVYDFIYLNGDENDYVHDKIDHESTIPSVVQVRDSRFKHNSVNFSYGAQEGYLQTGPFAIDDIVLTKTSGGDYLTVDSAMWINFWYKSPVSIVTGKHTKN